MHRSVRIAIPLEFVCAPPPLHVASSRGIGSASRSAEALKLEQLNFSSPLGRKIRARQRVRASRNQTRHQTKTDQGTSSMAIDLFKPTAVCSLALSLLLAGNLQAAPAAAPAKAGP